MQISEPLTLNIRSAPAVQEYFTWMGVEIDITALLEDVRDGKLKPRKDTFPAEFLEAYATKVLAVSKERAHEALAMGFFVSVSYDTIRAMPDTVFERPVVLACLGKKGILDIDGTGPQYLLIDGNHRVGKAYLEGRPSLDVLILSAAQVKKYCR